MRRVKTYLTTNTLLAGLREAAMEAPGEIRVASLADRYVGFSVVRGGRVVETHRIEIALLPSLEKEPKRNLRLLEHREKIARWGTRNLTPGPTRFERAEPI